MSAQQYKKNEGFIAERKLADECILIPMTTSAAEMTRLYQLNNTAAFIYEKAKEGMTDLEIAQALQNEFEVQLEEAKTDVLQTVEELIKCGALVPSEKEVGN